MFKEGQIKACNENEGYGFIQLEVHENDLFFHISDFPHKTFPPKIGERLKFSENGRIKAAKITS